MPVIGIKNFAKLALLLATFALSACIEAKSSHHSIDVDGKTYTVLVFFTEDNFMDEVVSSSQYVIVNGNRYPCANTSNCREVVRHVVAVENGKPPPPGSKPPANVDEGAD